MATLISSRSQKSNKCAYNIKSIIKVILILFILAATVLQNHRAESKSVYKRFSRGAVRLCSKNLSDALYLLCKDRGGFHEPFSNSEESDVGPQNKNPGPGLVEECCYNACGIDQMAQYCKNSSPKSNGQQGWWWCPKGILAVFRCCSFYHPSSRLLLLSVFGVRASVGSWWSTNFILVELCDNCKYLFLTKVYVLKRKSSWPFALLLSGLNVSINSIFCNNSKTNENSILFYLSVGTFP